MGIIGDPVICALCKQEVDKSNVYATHFKGNITYECINENVCREQQRKNKEIEKMAMLSDKDRGKIEKYKENIKKYGHLPQEEQFDMLFGDDGSFDDLSELPRFRDACVHYQNYDTGCRYTWDICSKKWRLMDEIVNGWYNEEEKINYDSDSYSYCYIQ